MWTKRVYRDASWAAAIIQAHKNFETTATEMVAAYTKAVEGLPTTERVIRFMDLEV